MWLQITASKRSPIVARAASTAYRIFPEALAVRYVSRSGTPTGSSNTTLGSATTFVYALLLDKVVSRSRLNCAIPPRPPNASVRNTSTRAIGSFSVHVSCPASQSPLRVARILPTQHPGAHRNGEAGLRAAQNFSGEPLRCRAREGSFPHARLDHSQRRHCPPQCPIHQRHANLHRVRHTRPVGIAQQLVAHVPRALQC